MNRTAYIFVPGVLNYPGSSTNWTDRAVTWMNVTRPNSCAEKFEYMALPLSRRIWANRRAEQLAALMERYPIESFSLVVAAHSNGCDLVRRALAISARPANFVHFFSPAVAADPRRHRLVRLVRDGRIGFLRIWLAGRDRVLGPGFLGGVAVDAVRGQFAEEHHTEVRAEATYGHGTWWKNGHFEGSMRRIAFHNGEPA